MIGLYSLQKKIQERKNIWHNDPSGAARLLEEENKWFEEKLREFEKELIFRKKELEKEEVEKEKPPVTHCPSCKKELTVGAVGPEGTKWGCYNFDCPRVKENNYYHYTIPFSRLYMKIEELDFVLGEKP